MVYCMIDYRFIYNLFEIIKFNAHFGDGAFVLVASCAVKLNVFVIELL